MANATDDLSQLFNDDLLGMDAGVGDAAAEEKAREALSSAMMADMAQERGVPLPRDDNRQAARGRNLDRRRPAVSSVAETRWAATVVATAPARARSGV